MIFTIITSCLIEYKTKRILDEKCFIKNVDEYKEVLLKWKLSTPKIFNLTLYEDLRSLCPSNELYCLTSFVREYNDFGL